MDYFHTEKMNALIAKAEGNPHYPSLSRKITLQYKLQRIEEPASCRQLVLRINSRMKRALQGAAKGSDWPETYCRNWALCEYKLFKTILVLYSICHSIQISEMKREELEELGGMFPRKERSLIEYEVAALASKSRKSLRQWSQQENSLLSSILRSTADPNWKEVAIELFRASGRNFFRQFSECREQWNSHLNPTISKAQWTRAEDFRLVELIGEYGFRWSAISKAMAGIRNEHMVKNRYNSLLRKMGRGQALNKQASSRTVWEGELLKAVGRVRSAEDRVEAGTEGDEQKRDESLTELSESNKGRFEEGKEDEFSIEKYLSLDQAAC